MKKVKNLSIISAISCNLLLGVTCLYAQDTHKITDLTKQIIESKLQENLYPVFEELKGLYLKDNKYNEFIELINSLGKKKMSLGVFIDYYTALARFQQLKYLEETQNWNEYFSKGEAIRQEIEKKAMLAAKAFGPKDPLAIYASLLLWKFYNQQQSPSQALYLTGLVDSAVEYAKGAGNPAPIKDAADQLLAFDMKPEARKLYQIYVNKLSDASIKDDDLKNIALEFYEKGNLELAETVYDAYLNKAEKVMPKEKITPVYAEIFKSFAYKDEGQKDPAYAEKIFEKLEKISSDNGINQELMYLRGFNLEKAHLYKEAMDAYLNLLKRFPAVVQADELNYKIGLIYTYILLDAEKGTAYFKGLSEKEKISPQVLSSLYQLGLLNQWKNNLEEAKVYYNKIIVIAKNGFSDTVALAQERLNEIKENKPIEYNLMTFLNSALDRQKTSFDGSNINLRSSPYRTKKDKQVKIDASSLVSESGCTPVALEYLWSGDLGSAKPLAAESSYSTQYSYPGTKVINLVVVTPSGVLDRSIDFVDSD